MIECLQVKVSLKIWCDKWWGEMPVCKARHLGRCFSDSGNVTLTAIVN